MFTKLSSLWDTIRSSLWFVPSVMSATAIALAFTLIWIDRSILTDQSDDTLAWLYGGGADGAREVLSVIAGSAITIAGVIFSITVVALTLASQQFGPRMLRNFMRDPGNQVVLGTFISIHLYCLIVLRAVRAPGSGEFVPHLSVSIALLLTLTGAGVLIYYFHHATSSIRASSVIAAVAVELDETIDRLFPTPVESPGPKPAVPPTDLGAECQRILSSKSGYFQVLDTDALMTLAKQQDVVIRMDRRPGDFITRDMTIASVFPSTHVSQDLVDGLQGALMLGDERTVVQDVLFPAHQLTEVAVRALSPSMNDPLTALACIDRLAAAFIRFDRRRTPSPYRYDDDEALRLIIFPVTLAELIDTSLGPIRQYGSTSVLITIHLLDTIALAASRVENPDARAALDHQAEMVYRASRQLPEEWDREAARKAFDSARESLTSS